MADNGHDQASGAPHVVIVGGGIAGLAAAFSLRDKPVRVTVLEGASRLGGKLAVSEVAGVAVDEGAEATYLPRADELVTEAGLDDQLASPGTTSRAVWTRGQMRPLPRQHMGVPADLDDLASSGVLSGDGLARARENLELPSADRNGDVSVATYVGSRLGQEVVDRLVDPWLAGVYAGRAEELSFEATLSPLAAASRKYPSLTEAAGRLIPRPRPGRNPSANVATLTGGFGRLPQVLTEAVLAASPGAAVRTGAMVSELARTEVGWRLTVGSAGGTDYGGPKYGGPKYGDTEYIAADAVIVAVPASAASRLLAGTPGAAPATAGLAEIPYANMAIITLAYPRQAFSGGLAERGSSGYMVPAVDGRAVKDVTFTTVKWPHLAGETEIVRCFIGRMGEEELLRRDDADLAALAASELAEATGAVGDPVATRVTRWDNALPQYLVGHWDRVARIRACVAAQPGLAVCGAAYDGVGIAACVSTARSAADQVLSWVLQDATARV